MIDAAPDTHAQTVRIGFVGAGGICRQRHLPGLAAIDGVRFSAVCNRSSESAQRIADEWGIAQVETDWRALIERDDVDAVVIGTWPYTHRQMSEAALAAGKHVFCQARMCMDWREACAMVAASKARPDRVAMLCPPPHRMPWEPYIRNRIEHDELGEIRQVRVVSVNAANADPQKITWREQIEFSGLQALQVGIFAETLHAWVGQYRRLGATTAIPLPRKTDEAGRRHEIRIPQIVAVQGELAGGAICSELHSGLSLSDQENSVTIEGAKGALRVDVMKSIAFASPGEAFGPVDVPPDEQADWRVERQFIDAVRAAMRGEAWSVDPDFIAGQRYMRKVQAVHDAASQGRRLELDAEYPMET